MTRPSTIIAASDLSDFSEHVATKAAHIAAHIDVDGRLLHVLEPNVLEAVHHWIDGGTGAADALRAQAAKALSDQSERVAERTGQSLSADVMEGSVLESVVASASPDALLVLGFRGLFVLRDMILGSTARHILYRHQGPVLIVKTETEQLYRQIMVATDFSAHSLRALERTASLFPDSKIEVVHIVVDLLDNRLSYSDVDEERVLEYREKARSRAETEMTQFLAKAELGQAQISSRVESGIPVQVLSRLAKQLDVDLLVTGKQGRTALKERLLGSVSQHLLQASKVDVLIEC
jgi:nucleotide-binding universal stress UspA family protein